MKKLLKDYFSFNKTERRGIFVLMILMVLLLAINLLIPHIRPKSRSDFTVFRQQIAEFERNRLVQKDKKETKNQQREFDFSLPDQSAGAANLKPFDFEPNQMKAEDWKRLGLTDRQIKSILKYREKGGVFRTKKDFQKLYCISDEEYRVLEPYLLLPETLQNRETGEKQPAGGKNEKKPLIDINTATAEDFIKLRGIGNYFADKIVKYRELLGGFYRLEQLLEVRGMDSLRYNQILPYLTLHQPVLRVINVNEAGFDELRKHPYIGYNIALSLVNYRNKHGKFAHLTDIKKSALVNNEVYSRISPYLTVE